MAFVFWGPRYVWLWWKQRRNPETRGHLTGSSSHRGCLQAGEFLCVVRRVFPDAVPVPQRAPLSLACLVVTEAQGISTHAASDPSLPSFWAVQRREGAFLPPPEKPVLDLAFQSWGRVRIRIRKSWPYTFFRTRTGSKGPVCMASPHLLPHLAVCHGQSDTAGDVSTLFPLWAW